MLNKIENEVMQAIFELCKENGRCLISPKDLANHLPKKENCSEEKLEKILRALELDDYFELISSDRKGEKMYVIALRPNGFAFRRSSRQMRRTLALKVIWSLLSAILAFLVGVLLKRIF
jgi:hypothetical protein